MSQPPIPEPPSRTPAGDRNLKIAIWAVSALAILAFGVLMGVLISKWSSDDEAAADASTTTWDTTIPLDIYPTSTTTSTTTPTTETTTATTVGATTTTPIPATTTTELQVFALAPDGVVVVDFGADPATTIAAISAVLGPPTHDFDWQAAYSCIGPEIKEVRWGDVLTVRFTSIETDWAAEGTRHFAEFSAWDNTAATVDGFRVGDTYGDLYAFYPPGAFAGAEYDIMLLALRIEVEGDPGTSESLTYFVDTPEVGPPALTDDIILIHGGVRLCFD